MSKSSGNNKRPQPRLKSNTSKSNSGTKILSGTALWAQRGSLLLLAISVVIVLQTRLRLLAIPMERDEGGFAYIGHWLLKGKSLYVDMVDNKLPGLYVLYGIFTTLFGYNAIGVHIGLLLANIASGICFYFLLKDVYNQFIAATATAFLSMLLVSPYVLGFAAHATQLLLPFALGGFLCFWKGIRSGRKVLFLITGLLLGYAFIIKQQSVVFGLLAAVLWWPLRLAWNKKESERMPFLEWIFLGIGGLIPVVTVVLYFKLTGRADQLYFWSVKQPSGMTSTFINTSGELIRHFVPIVTLHVEALWVAGAVGLILVFISGFGKGAAWFGSMLAVCGLGSVVIGAAYYQHYFILALPGIALLTAISLHWIMMKTGKAGVGISMMIAAILLLKPISADEEYFFSPDYNRIHQVAYSKNMFPELERIARELALRAPEGSRIGIMGSEPEVLVMADRESCSKHLFMYPLLSDPVLSPPMQDEYLQDMETCQPEFIVWNTGSGSWTSGYDQLQMVKNLVQWLQQNYTPIGIAEFRQNKPGEIVWDDALKSFQSQSEEKIYIFRKK